MFVACKGERDFIRLTVLGGDWGRSTPLATDASKREFGGTSTNVLFDNSLKPIVFDPAASAVGGRQYVSMRRGRVLKVLEIKNIKGGRASKRPRRPKV